MLSTFSPALLPQAGDPRYKELGIPVIINEGYPNARELRYLKLNEILDSW